MIAMANNDVDTLEFLLTTAEEAVDVNAKDYGGEPAFVKLPGAPFAETQPRCSWNMARI